MKYWLIILLLVFTARSHAAEPVLATVRALYQTAPEAEKDCRQLLAILGGEQKEPVMVGYKAVATMIMAKHLFNPFTKLSYFNRGKKMLEKAIQADKENLELRILRLSIQVSVPGFLGYSDKVDEDRRFIQQRSSMIKDPYLLEVGRKLIQQPN